jgi:hypothetical protein
MSEAANPYAAPTARVDDAGVDSEAEKIRREHLNHEASIKAVGALYYLSGLMLTLAAFGTAISARDASLGAGALLLVLAALMFAAGWGVRSFRRWGRVVGCVLSGIGLLGFPIGTLINAYILYLFLSKKGRTVFSPEYQDVIAATPHVKYRTSIIVWILLALVGALVVVGIGVMVIGGR